MVAQTSLKAMSTAQSQAVDRLEVLSVMIDALWLYLRSVSDDEAAADELLRQKLKQADDSLYEIMSYLEEKN
jgi:hypothetical protein